MDPDKKFLKTKSQKVLNAVQKELKKISPIGASKRHTYKDPKLPRGTAENIAKRIMQLTENHKYINGPLLSYIEANYNINDAHIRLPFNPDDRRSTLSPASNHTPTSRTPEKSPETIRRISLQRMMSVNEEPERKKSSPNLAALNEIIEACDKASGCTEKVIPCVMKSFSRQLNTLASDVEKVIFKSRGTSNEEKRIVEENLTREFSENGRKGTEKKVNTRIVIRDRDIGSYFRKNKNIVCD